MKRHYIYPDISEVLINSKHTPDSVRNTLLLRKDFHGFLLCGRKVFKQIQDALIKEGFVSIPSELVDVWPLKKAALVPYVRYTIIYGVPSEENVRITQLIRSKYKLSGWEAIVKEAWGGLML